MNKKFIKIDKVKQLVNKNILNQLILKNEYEVKYVDPITLITPNRLDIIFKILYLEYKTINLTLAKEIYYKHIQALTFNTFIEDDKKSIEDFYKKFTYLENSIKSSGLQETLIPISNKFGSIADGSHRISLAYFYKLKIPTIELDIKDQNYNYEFFIRNNFPKRLIELAILKYCQIINESKILIIWPSSNLKDNQINKYFNKIIYKKKLNFNKNGQINFIKQIYANEKWLGNKINNYKGANEKKNLCFKKNKGLHVIIINNKIDNAINIKNKIRKVSDIGKHSIHSVDKWEKVLEMSNLLLNNNGINFLNFSSIEKFKITNNIFQTEIMKLLSKNNNYIFTSGIVLALYGIRNTKDIDYISLDNLQIEKNNLSLFDNHSKNEIYLKMRLENLIYDPDNFFYFKNLKFLSLKNIVLFKRMRDEIKDKEDILIINNFLKENNYNNLKKNKIILLFYSFKNYTRANYHFLRLNIINITKKLGIYYFIKKYKNLLIK